MLSPDAIVATWAEGVNGRRWQERHLTGREQLRGVLDKRGFRRIPEQTGGPVFRETEAKVSGEGVTFMLRPDRLGRDDKPYNPYKVEAVFAGCKIQSLTVIEYISWE